MNPEQGYKEWSASDTFVNTTKDAFLAGVEWAAAHPKPGTVKLWEGCRACFGSGGKRIDPCNVCNGTGKVKRGSSQRGNLNQTGTLTSIVKDFERQQAWKDGK